ncbi:ABC transporter ATP-binding protein [Crocinitomix sp.]|nr:ABC transporter ATP-binding protein [Crocinitomix sp.]
MLTFKDLKIKVNGRELFELKDLSLGHGLVALVGRNGAGKSTFLRSIMGLHQDYSGAILLNDTNTKSFSRVELAKEIAIVYSKASIFGNHSGRDVLILGRLPYQNAFARIKKEDHEKVNAVIELFGLADFVDQEFTSLSDGEKQLIMIGRALVQETKIILLDEPGAFLDVVNRYRMNEILQKIAKESDRLILYSTHDIESLQENADKVLLIDNNRIELLADKLTFKRDIFKIFGLKRESDEI